MRKSLNTVTNLGVLCNFEIGCENGERCCDRSWFEHTNHILYVISLPQPHILTGQLLNLVLVWLLYLAAPWSIKIFWVLPWKPLVNDEFYPSLTIVSPIAPVVTLLYCLFASLRKNTKVEPPTAQRYKFVFESINPEPSANNICAGTSPASILPKQTNKKEVSSHKQQQQCNQICVIFYLLWAPWLRSAPTCTVQSSSPDTSNSSTSQLS